MNEKIKLNRNWITGGAIALLVGAFLFGNSAHGLSNQASGKKDEILPITTLKSVRGVKNNTWEQKLDGWLSSILEEVDSMISNVMPEGYEEWGSFVRYGDTIARQVDDGYWEYSTDGGETWTDKEPEGFSISEDLDDFDIEGLLRSLWP